MMSAASLQVVEQGRPLLQHYPPLEREGVPMSFDGRPCVLTVFLLKHIHIADVSPGPTGSNRDQVPAAVGNRPPELGSIHADGFRRADQLNISMARKEGLRLNSLDLIQSYALADKRPPSSSDQLGPVQRDRAMPGARGDPDLRASQAHAKRSRDDEAADVDAVIAADEVVAVAHVYSPIGRGAHKSRRPTGHRSQANQ